MCSFFAVYLKSIQIPNFWTWSVYTERRRSRSAPHMLLYVTYFNSKDSRINSSKLSRNLVYRINVWKNVYLCKKIAKMESPAKPKIWKMILISWLFVYPVVNIMFLVIFPLLTDYNQLIKTLVFTLILVPIMGISIPKLHQRFWKWNTK